MGIQNILMVGVGGQGIILASNIMTQAALEAGFDAKKSEIHGMSQRGGSVFSHIRYGKKIFSPVISRGSAHILLSLEEMETLRWLTYANADTEVIVLQNRINPANTTSYPAGIEAELKLRCPKLHLVDPAAVLQGLSDKKFINVCLLGLLASRINIDEEAWRRAVESQVPQGTCEQNWEAFNSGRRLA